MEPQTKISDFREIKTTTCWTCWTRTVHHPRRNGCCFNL